MNKSIIDAYRHFWGGFGNDSDAEVESRLNTEMRRYAAFGDNSVCIFKGQPALFEACKADSTLIYVTTCTSQALTANGANTVNFPAWDIEIADPT